MRLTLGKWLHPILWIFRDNPGFVRGQMRFLLNRAPDPVMTRPPDIDPTNAEQALKIIWDAFGIPKSQRNCLRPDDKLLDLYHSIYPPGFPDCLDFNHLEFQLEKATGRKIFPEELLDITVAGVMRLLNSENMKHKTAL